MVQAAGQPRLIVRDASGRRTILLDKPVLTFGRRSESDVRLVGADVSRLHAEIRAGDGCYRLKDCGSRFGTYVNGQRIDEHDLQPARPKFGFGQEMHRRPHRRCVGNRIAELRLLSGALRRFVFGVRRRRFRSEGLRNPHLGWGRITRLRFHHDRFRFRRGLFGDERFLYTRLGTRRRTRCRWTRPDRGPTDGQRTGTAMR